MTPAEIKQHRETLGLTQAQIAPLLGYSATQRVSEIERGTRNPSDAAAQLLQAYLNGYRPPDWPKNK